MYVCICIGMLCIFGFMYVCMFVSVIAYSSIQLFMAASLS